MKSSWNSASIIPITLSFHFLFLLNFGDVFAAPTRHLCRHELRDALIEFKNEFDVQKTRFATPHPKMESWENKSDCCYWKGIKCETKSGQLIELDLSGSCLSGQFHSNSSLFRLQSFHFLTSLDLSSNDISGQIPSSIGNLPHLISLDLSTNNFSSQIPFSIGNLSHLTYLDLSSNNFSGQIPSLIGNLSHLNSLDLSFNRFSGQIPSSIGNLSHLTSLSLLGNDFSGQIQSLFEKLSHMTSLISLSFNRFSGQIPSSIGNLSHLTLLGLSNNDFVGEIPSSFGSLNELTVLSLGFNKLSGKIPISLLNLTKLSALRISHNQLTGTLSPNITSLSKLSLFEANDNAFTGALPSSLFTIPSLSYIDLRDNQFNNILESRNISTTPSNLIYLDISSNNFRGPIPRSISRLVNLDKLDLSHFNIQGPVDFSIFSHLKSLRYLNLSQLNTTTTIELSEILSCFTGLYQLDLSGNHVSVADRHSQLISELYLSGCGITEFPELLRTQHELWFLDISNNKIKGQVPAWLWTLPQLVYVNLSNNTFTSFERSKKRRLSKPSMEHLLASNNNFTGKIPSFICTLRSLRTLDLSNNNFNGSIPRCMENLKKTLSVLNLSQNRLSGGLPDNIFESLRSLDVGHNQLVGKLPRSLIHCSTLEVLNVESNRINHTFPFWLSSLKNLQVLVLRSNAFHGPIHQASFRTLRILDLSHNHFNGTLPSNYFMNWKAMSSLEANEDQSNARYMRDILGYYYDSVVLINKGVAMELVRILTIYTALDFSGNKLEGEIPRSMGLLKELHVLNLSNNAFTGHIPSSMGNLTALESLDVSRNQLSGEIPQELGNLSYLAYMNFSHNQLVGLVPGGTQFQTQPCSSFEDNRGLYGPSLDEVCRDIHTTTSQQSETPEHEEDEEVLNWIAAAIGFMPGIFFGLTIGYILVSYKPELFMNPFGRNNRRSRSIITH